MSTSLINFLSSRIEALEAENVKLREENINWQVVVRDLCQDEVPQGYKEQQLKNIFK
jgi:FtsZ-binding cell division protein ZapB